MLELDKVTCNQFAACLNQDFEIVRRGTTADYTDVADEKTNPGSSSLLFSIRVIRVIRG
jgi:hypothetical protein